MGLVIFGAGRFARLMHHYFTHDSDHEVVAFAAHESYLTADTLLDLPVLPLERLKQQHPPETTRLFSSLGYRNMRARRETFEQLKELGYELVNYVSSRSIVWIDPEAMGQNNVIMHNVQIEPFATIGDNNLFWSNTLIGHDASVGSHNYMAANVTIAGGCSVGDLCFLGNGTISINDVELADETHALPGSVIYANTSSATKYLGNPAKAIWSHHKTGIVIERS